MSRNTNCKLWGSLFGGLAGSLIIPFKSSMLCKDVWLLTGARSRGSLDNVRQVKSRFSQLTFAIVTQSKDSGKLETAVSILPSTEESIHLQPNFLNSVRNPLEKGQKKGLETF